MRASTLRSLPTLGLSVCIVLAPACGDSSGSGDEEQATGSEGETSDSDASTAPSSGSSGDGDGDSGDGDGDGDSGDGDGDGDACEPDPPHAESQTGVLEPLPEPTPDFNCSLDEGNGFAFQAGLLAPGPASTLDFVDFGADGKLYAAGSHAGSDGLVLGVELGNNPNNNLLWARRWSYDAGAGSVRAMVAQEGARVWLSTAPEHLLALDYDGQLLAGPLEQLQPGVSFISTLEPGDGQLLLGVEQRGAPPTCLGTTRVQTLDPLSAAEQDTSDGTFTTQVFGIRSDGAGGVWLATLDLNGQGATITHIDADANADLTIPVSNADANAIGGDFAVASNGEPLLALRGPFIIELYRFAQDGTQQWMATLPALGTDYNPSPHIAVDANDTVTLAIDVDASLGLAQVDAGGNVGSIARWSCGDAVRVTDVAVSANGNDIWVSGTQGEQGWLANLQ